MYHPDLYSWAYFSCLGYSLCYLWIGLDGGYGLFCCGLFILRFNPLCDEEALKFSVSI